MNEPQKRSVEPSSVDVDLAATVGGRGQQAPEKLHTLPTIPPPSEGAGQPAAPAEGASMLGRYQLVSMLGQGGMGVVYEGYDPELDRRVALKILHRDAGNRSWLVREGQALARLAHPHVVGIHEVGEHDGHVFLAMEYVEGPTLRQWLKAKRQSPQELLRVFVQAARGLVAAHAAGLVHRDFKPDNVFIGNDGRVRVGDFGIATAADRAPAAPEGPPSIPSANLLDSPLTRAGAVVGTPAFMSPEQFAGQAVTPLSDQWSFCVALYEAVYKVRPFVSDDVKQLGLMIVGGAPATPPSLPSLPDVPPWLAPIILRGLAKDPTQRFPTMSALIDAIEEHLPRDPQLDPAVVLRERLIISGAFVALTTAWAVLYLIPAGARWLLSSAGVIGAPLVMLATLATVVALRWRRMSRNMYGRQLAALSIGIASFVLLQHFVGLRIGIPATAIVMEDLVLLSVYYGVVAFTMERWVGVLSAVFAVAAFAGSFDSSRAPLAFGLAGLANVVAMGVRLYLDRHLTPEELI